MVGYINSTFTRQLSLKLLLRTPHHTGQQRDLCKLVMKICIIYLVLAVELEIINPDFDIEASYNRNFPTLSEMSTQRGLC